jgi:hypothetical protein
LITNAPWLAAFQGLIFREKAIGPMPYEELFLFQWLSRQKCASAKAYLESSMANIETCQIVVLVGVALYQQLLFKMTNLMHLAASFAIKYPQLRL